MDMLEASRKPLASFLCIWLGSNIKYKQSKLLLQHQPSTPIWWEYLKWSQLSQQKRKNNKCDQSIKKCFLAFHHQYVFWQNVTETWFMLVDIKAYKPHNFKLHNTTVFFINLTVLSHWTKNSLTPTNILLLSVVGKGTISIHSWVKWHCSSHGYLSAPEPIVVMQIWQLGVC